MGEAVYRCEESITDVEVVGMRWWCAALMCLVVASQAWGGYDETTDAYTLMLDAGDSVCKVKVENNVYSMDCEHKKGWDRYIYPSLGRAGGVVQTCDPDTGRCWAERPGEPVR